MINIAYFLENCGYMYKTDDGKYRIDIDDRVLHISTTLSTISTMR